MRCSCSAESIKAALGNWHLANATRQCPSGVQPDAINAVASALAKCQLPNANGQEPLSHLVLAHIVLAQVLQPFAQLVAGGAIVQVAGDLAVLQHLVIDEDGAIQDRKS